MGVCPVPGHFNRTGKKLTEAVSWRYGEKRKYCETCLEAANQNNKERDCESCSYRMPDLLPENEPLFDCFILCETQLRTSAVGAFALDWGVIVRVAEDLGIKTDLHFYTLLGTFERALLQGIGGIEKLDIQKNIDQKSKELFTAHNAGLRTNAKKGEK